MTKFLQNLLAPFKWLFSTIFIVLIKIYQWVISPILPGSCRYNPTCSHYSVDAIKQHGPFYGFLLSFFRILSCNPWFGGYGNDAVPEKFSWKALKLKRTKEE